MLGSFGPGRIICEIVDGPSLFTEHAPAREEVSNVIAVRAVEFERIETGIALEDQYPL
jgi:hypothetical protein